MANKALAERKLCFLNFHVHRNLLGFSYHEDPDTFDVKWDQGVGISNKFPGDASVQLPHFEEAEELLRKGPFVPRPHSSYIFSDDVVSVIRSNIQAALVETDKKLQSGRKSGIFYVFSIYSILQSSSSGSL